MGKRGAARAGRIPAGRPLYGYTKDDEGRPVIDEHEAIVVSRLFGMYVDQGVGVPTIARTLNKEYGFKRTAPGLYWMLRNQTYAGKMVYDGVEIPCPPIVTRATWDRTQELLTKKTIRACQGQHQGLLLATADDHLRQLRALAHPLGLAGRKTGRS